jgi:hypothetical protein
MNPMKHPGLFRIKTQTTSNGKCLRPFTVEGRDGQGEAAATVHKTVFFRGKQAR